MRINWLSSINRIVWAVELDEVSPIARLVAVFIADKFDPVEPATWSEDPPSLSGPYDDADLVSSISRASGWIGCSPDDVVMALRELADNHGLRIIEIRDGSVRFRFPESPPEQPIARPPRPERTISIYVISAGDATKIGISAFPANRVASLQASSPFTKLKLEFAADGTKSFIRKVERLAHARLADQAMGNEWFRIETRAAIALVKSLLEDA